jgi:hypothetical protein
MTNTYDTYNGEPISHPDYLPTETAIPDIAPPGQQWMDPYDAYLQQEGAPEVFFEGKYFNFNGQTGVWTCGKQQQPINLAERLLCNIAGVAVGWIRMLDNKIDTRVLGFLIEGYLPTTREALPDQDKTKWPFNKQGVKEDPWKKAIYLPMRTEQGESVVFAPMAATQINAVHQFLRTCRRTGRDGLDPVVTLGSESFRNAHDGTTWKPTFTFRDWQYWISGTPRPEPRPVLVSSEPAKPAAVAIPPSLPSRSGDLDDMDDIANTF